MKPTDYGPFEQIGKDIILSHGTKDHPVPNHARRLAIALIHRAGPSRVAHLDERLRESAGITANQFKSALKFLQRWPVEAPLVLDVSQRGLIFLRDVPANGGMGAGLSHAAAGEHPILV